MPRGTGTGDLDHIASREQRKPSARELFIIAPILPIREGRAGQAQWGTGMQAEVDESAIIKANAQFWEQMLAMTLSPLDRPSEFCVGPGHVQATVGISGAWNGSIEVRLEQKLAVLATSAMLMQPVETVGQADTLDASKEIANMIAGVIKSSLPRPCNMTVPESGVIAEGFCSPGQTDDSMMVAFRHEAGELMVRIFEGAMPAAA